MYSPAKDLPKLTSGLLKKSGGQEAQWPHKMDVAPGPYKINASAEGLSEIFFGGVSTLAFAFCLK